MPVYSFDIFDTLITRETATAQGIFAIMQHKLRNRFATRFPVQLVEEFFYVRTEAENKARAKCEYEECTFEGIYYEIQQRFHLSQEQVKFLRKIEIESELKSVVGIPANIERVYRLLDQGFRVLFISDTYMSEDLIRSLLAVVDLRLSACPMYVSSEKKVAKHSGNLFRLVLKEEKIAAKMLFHFGDNIDSDYVIPKRLGIHAQLFQNVGISEYERPYFVEDRLYIQLFAGVTKNYRLLHPDAQPIERVGGCLGGAILYGFVDSVLRYAIREGPQRIYFLARDGQILMKIAEEIKKKKEIELDFKYLYVSRQVCYLSSLYEVTQREIYWLRDFMSTFKNLAQRLNDDPAELFSLLPEALRVQIGGVEQKLTKKLINKICEFMLKKNSLSKRICQRCAKFREIFYSYLEQQGLFEADRLCIVDVGWSGKMQDSLYKVIAEYDPSIKITYHYFGMLGKGWERYTPYTSILNEKRAYIDLPMEVRNHVSFMEALTSADHETTVSYTRNREGRVDAILARSGGDNNWGLVRYQSAVTWFAEKFCAVSVEFPGIFNYHRDIVPIMLRQVTHPSREVAECLGDFPYTLGHDNKSLRRLAPRLYWHDIIAWCMNRHNTPASWLGGALQRSSWHVRYGFIFLFWFSFFSVSFFAVSFV